MGDTVQLILERMVPELEDLQERGLFTEVEIKSIIQRRRDAEYTFIKRTAEQDDYLRALQYELSLEALRRKRRERLALTKTSISDHAGTRRIHFIFDRACRKFRGDVRWWLQWLDFALRTNSAKAVGKILARALQLHPRSEELWLQAAEFEFDRQRNVTAARALLLRALRINRVSSRLWLAYFRLECLYVLLVAGRRLVLGLDVGKAFSIGAGEGAVLLPASAVEAGVGIGVGTDAGTQDSAGYIVQDADAEEDGGLGAVGDTPGLVVGAGSGAEAVSDAAAAAGVPEPEVSGVSSSDSLSFSLSSFLANADARTAFFAGSVPRIVYQQAVRAAPKDLSLRAQFLDACDKFMDVTGSASLHRTGPVAPAFPALSAHVLSSIATDFGEEAATWELLARRPAAGLKNAVIARAKERTAYAGDHDAQHAAAVSGHGAIESAPDGELFQIDNGKKRKAEHELDGVREDLGPDFGAEDANEEDTSSSSFDGRGLPLMPTHVRSLEGLSEWLSSGQCDVLLLTGLPKPAGTISDAVYLQLPRVHPSWVATLMPQALTAATAFPQRKKAKAGVKDSGSAELVTLTLYSPRAVDSVPEPDAELEAWTRQSVDEGKAVLADAIGHASVAKDVPKHMSLLLASARLHVDAIALPLVPSIMRTVRMHAQYESLAMLCGQAVVVGTGAGNGCVSRQVLTAGLLQVQALLRLGRVADALAAAETLATSLPTEAAPVLLKSRLWHLLAGLPASATATTTLLQSAPVVLPRSSILLPSGLPITVQCLTGWVSPASTAFHVADVLRAGLATVAQADIVGSSALWMALIHATLFEGGEGAAAAAVSVITEAGRAGLTQAVEAEVRECGFNALATAEFPVTHLAAALSPGCPPATHAHALALMIRAWQSETVRTRGSKSNGQRGEARGVGDEQVIRRVFDMSVAQHGSKSSALWLLYLHFERECAVGPSSSSLATVSTVYERAQRSLTGAEAALFLEKA